MKKSLFTLSFFILLLQGLFAQLPQAINYQAVARNGSGAVIANSSIALRFSIHDGSVNGTVLYAERDTATTNQFGLFTVAIGSGNVINGAFAGIDWSSAAKFLEVDLDPAGGSQYTTMGVSQMLSVPYALFAQKSHIADTALTNSGWQLTGNSGTNSNTDFIGTTDNQSLRLRVNNSAAGFISQYGGVFYGIGAGVNDPGIRFNIGIGDSALMNSNESENNIAIGVKALMNNTGPSNFAIGYQTMMNSTNGQLNIAIGDQTLYSNATGRSNIGLGHSVLAYNTTGSYNTVVGHSAMLANTTGQYNSCLGLNSLYGNISGNYNTALGFSAMDRNITGNSSIAIGVQALFTNTSISNLIAIGDSALLNLTDGVGANTAVGSKAMMNTTTGYNNTALGQHALFNTTIGYNNTAIGLNSLSANTTGNGNTTVGCQAYPTTASVTNYTGLGYDVGSNTSASNSVELGNSSVTTIRAQVASITTYSDARVKDDVQANVPGLAFINLLRPVTYRINLHRENEIIYADKPNQTEWEGKYDIEKITQSGFIAQEVEAAANAVGYNFNGLHKPTGPTDLYGLGYTNFVMPLVKSVQELSAMIQQLQKDNEVLHKQIEALQNK